jgi:hypothetical protein
MKPMASDAQVNVASIYTNNSETNYERERKGKKERDILAYDQLQANERTNEGACAQEKKTRTRRKDEQPFQTTSRNSG